MPSLSQLDTIMQQYMTQYSSPGGALSVSVDGRLIFARGYGYANTTTGEFVQPDSRFRIASNSKPITATGILKLIEQGKLSLSTQPFATILNDLTPPPGTTIDPRVRSITIQELLEHKAGYDDGAGYPQDPTQAYIDTAADTYSTTPPATPVELISYMLGQPLQHDPGTTYAYSNLGYLTLGYIIERVTGMPYATWIEQNVFNIAKMTQTLPGGSLEANKLPYEVHYYDYPGAPLVPSYFPPVGTPVPYPYGGYSYELALANGGWTSTPMDLLRFWDTLNGQYPTNILNGPQSTRIGDVPPVGQGYFYTFYGSLPGVNSLVHLNTSNQVVGRVVYSATFNTRDGSNIEEPESDVDNAIQTFVQTVKSWPSGDLNPTYATSGTACSFTLASSSATAPMAGSTGTVGLTDANFCAWSATSNSSWIHVTAGALNSDSSTVGYTVDANTGSARTGTITIAGLTYSLTQGGVTTPTTLMLSGTGSLKGSAETVTLTATLSPYTVNGISTDGEIITFQDGGNTPALGTAMLSGGVAMLTAAVPNPQINAFQATYPGDSTFSSSFSAPLAITPTSTSATVSPATLTFPSTPTGVTSAAMSSTFTNTGTTTLSIGLIMVSGPFKQTNTCGGSVNAGATCTFTVTYAPTAVGTSSGSIDVSDQAGDQIITLSGTATAAAPVVTLSPTSLTFPSTTINTSSAAQSVTITNTGNAPLSISNVAAASGANQFTQTNNCTSAAIAVNASCTVSVTFSPTTTGAITASLLITDNATPTSQSVALSGTGAVGPTPAATLAPASLSFPATQVASTSPAQTSMLTNTGTASLTISGITASAGFSQTNTCPASLAVNASCSITVTSSPTAVGAYTGSISITDNAGGSPQAIALSGTGAAFSAPTISLSGSTSLIYGQPETLTASATGVQANGSYTWSILDGATAVTSGAAYSSSFMYTIPTPTAGTHSYTAVLTSTNTTTYPTGTSNAVVVAVAKASTTSSYAMPAAITYGVPLGATQLDATSSTAGTFTYTPPAGTVLPAGMSPISATLNPTDATDFNTSSASTTITVNKASLAVTAANASRPYGAANPTLTGNISGIVNSDPITATYTSTATAAAPAGSTATITPNLVDPSGRLVNYNVTSTSASLTIVKAGSTLSLTAPASVGLGASVTFTATAASVTSGVPTGSVTFASTTGSLGTAVLNNGVATLTVTLPTGPSSVTATYAGDTNYNGSTSSAVSVLSGAPDFSVTATPTSANLTSGESAQFVFSTTAINGFNTAVTFTCAGLPAYSSCTFTPATVSPTSTAVSSTLIFSTMASMAASRTSQRTLHTGIGGAFLALLVGLPLLRRRQTRLRSLLALLLLIGFGGAAVTLTGCGDAASNRTPTGTYSFTVNAVAGTTSHATVLTVSVTGR